MQPPAVHPGTAYPQQSPYSTAQPGGGAQGGDGAQGTAQTAKDEGRRVAGEAQESAKRVAGEVKDEGRKVAGEAKRQARQVYEQARTEVSQQAATQQGRLADGLVEMGSDFDEMSNATDSSGLAATLVSEAAARTGDFGRWLQNREPDDVLQEVKRFARRRPVTFVAVAAVAGIVAGRLTRGLVDDAKDEGTTP
ncbi:hypothetical protein GCM10011490_22480 [Pseudoclavibacter endophyticus]|uniref:Uncharacterized protein n=1 Tax=Pseudoclavibacter endophyticus TaxID=1778590 RepID=A0A6H9WC78_9MICO|nr:hypothetical protein [Pseudoclavibacter endophyticus]KAB1648283.1 hypothetical protein F8O04_11300 [Pseudoclavibacter endophyticus]GGA71305.1 hypothetical protein GCM10011490_22480 [Pseudoclavibacter endophyticus]